MAQVPCNFLPPTLMICVIFLGTINLCKLGVCVHGYPKASPADKDELNSDLESIQSDDDKKYEEDDVEFLGYSYDPTNVKQEEVEFVGHVINEGKCTLHYAFWL